MDNNMNMTTTLLVLFESYWFVEVHVANVSGFSVLKLKVIIAALLATCISRGNVISQQGKQMGQISLWQTVREYWTRFHSIFILISVQDHNCMFISLSASMKLLFLEQSYLLDLAYIVVGATI